MDPTHGENMIEVTHLVLCPSKVSMRPPVCKSQTFTAPLIDPVTRGVSFEEKAKDESVPSSASMYQMI
jgi:hypothetical protein